MRHSIPDISEHMTDVALHYLTLGFRPIPIVPGTKRAAIKWKKFQSVTPTKQEVRQWFSSGAQNIALMTGNGVVVVDVDDAGQVNEVLRRCGDTPMRCRTPSGGMHLYYASQPGVHCGNAVRVRGMPIDLRCDGAYAVCPWSRSEWGGSYEWTGNVVAPRMLPPLPMSWLRTREKRRLVAPAVALGDPGRAVRRARGYLAMIEGAIAGHRGHDRTFRVACVLAIKFGLTLAQAWPLFSEWNEQCEPPWSDKELLHKLQDAFKLRRR